MMVFVYILGLLAVFYLLARIVDDYFIESLDKLAQKLKMSSDAAGATLMAVGSSAPELFVAIFAVFHPDGNHESIAVGNIVGSALFNILAITGAAAFVRKALIAWQPVVRDLAFYLLSILLLLYVFIDSRFTMLDAGLFIALYVVYVVVVIYWRRMVKYTDPNEEIIEEEEEEEENKKKTGLIGFLTRPMDLVLRLIFPSSKHYVITFFLSIIIIAALSWLMVESAVAIAEILHISEAIIAVTILAAGTSVPDLLSSMIVSKQGRGGMAISNAIGSNIFDILIGLGLPFLLIIFMKGEDIKMQIGNLETSVEFLLASVLVLLGLFIVNKWVAGKRMGIFLILLYAAYLVYAVLTIS